MASKGKESSGLGKERKITPPSSIPIPNTPTKKTPKSSPRGSTTDHKLPFSSSSTTLPEKPVPNYLKSTASSRPDHTTIKPNKKPSAPSPIPEGKPSLNRRRSFDKPPSTAPRLDKPFRSPGPRNRANHVPARSSSFGAKSSTTIISSPKPGLFERSSSKVSKVGGGGKPHLQVQTSKSSNNVKKSLKRESSNAASTSAVEHVDESPSFVLGMSKEDLKTIQHELDPCLPDPIPELDKELSTDQVEKGVVLDQKEAEADETQRAADAESSIEEEANRERNGGEIVEVVSAVASEESTDNKSEEKIVTEEEEAEEKRNSTTEKEVEVAAVAEAVEKPRQGGSGKKESPAMYNHVIEETTNKLLEGRKNKVRALAGAFQTVIDYESSSK